ncbi:MAG: hypothetical protein KIT34_08490 [Cyanobacteria bacterium TGS_CYA1]|nr:hypothetical protein [Cyanobacteria bacterium TGS_CYA1]
MSAKIKKDRAINLALFKSTLEEWRYNPAFIPIMAIGFLFLIGYSIVSVTFVDAPIHEATFSSVFWTALPSVALLGAGIIGKNVSSGILSVLFARPIRRYSYVLTRWLALSVASSALCLILLAIEQIAAMAAFPGILPDFNTLSQAVARVSMCFGLSATFVMFSSIFPNTLDLGIWIMLSFSSNLIVEISHIEPYMISQISCNDLNRKITEFVVPICKELAIPIQSLVSPYLDLAYLTHTGSVSWYAVFTYFSNIGLCLLIAIAIMNRKEVSYASK